MSLEKLLQKHKEGKLVGAFSGISQDDYHAAPGLSSSQVKIALRSMSKFKASLGVKQKIKHQFEFGKAAHSAILEKQFTAFVKGPGVARNTKIWKDFVKSHPGKIHLKPEDYEHVRGMYEKLHAHEASKLLEIGKKEISFWAVCPITGLLIKARTDSWGKEQKFILDYKSCRLAEPWAIDNAMKEYHYPFSMMFYKYVMGILGIEVEDIFLVFQEKDLDYDLRKVNLDHDSRAEGNRLLENALGGIAQCQSTGVWPGYPTEVISAGYPKYYYFRDENNF